MQIKDGTGKGYLAGVNALNQVKVCAVSLPFEHYVNHNLMLSYSLQFSYTATGSACVLYLKNTDSSYDMSFGQAFLNVDTNVQLEVAFNSTGTPANGAALTPVNLNAGSSNEANGTFYGGNDVTGISKGNVVMKMWLASSNATANYELPTTLVIPQNSTMTFHLSGAATLNGTLFFNFHGAF